MSRTIHGYRVSFSDHPLSKNFHCLTQKKKKNSYFLYKTVPFLLIRHWSNGHSTSNLTVQLLSTIWHLQHPQIPILYRLKWFLNLERLKLWKVFVSWWRNMGFEKLFFFFFALLWWGWNNSTHFIIISSLLLGVLLRSILFFFSDFC